MRQYDHNVQGSTALHPFGGENFDAPNDAVVLRPILAKKYGFVTAHGLNPVLNKIDPYLGSVWAIAEAVSNYVAVGGDLKDAALIDNFIWPFPDEESLADLDKSVEACVDVAKILKMPFVSGKDSLSSTYRYPDSPLPAKIRRRKASGKVLKIPPVLLISVFGKIPDVTKTASSDFKKSGSTIVLVGKSDFKNVNGKQWRKVNIDYQDKYTTQQKLLYCLIPFLIISVIFWFISRLFFYIFIKENFFSGKLVNLIRKPFIKK